MSEAKPSEIGWRKDLMEESKESKDSKESDQRVKKYHKLSSDSSGSSDESGDDSSSSSDEKNRKVEKKEKRKEAKLAKKMKKEKRKLEKIQRKEMKKASKKRYKEEKRDMKKLSKIVGKERLQEAEADCSVPLDLMCNKALAPETPEEYQAKQKQIRRVVDPETGRTRLIKGDGEILEEIVTKDRHKEINKQATKSDGDFYQKNTVGWNLKKD